MSLATHKPHSPKNTSIAAPRANAQKGSSGKHRATKSLTIHNQSSAFITQLNKSPSNERHNNSTLQYSIYNHQPIYKSYKRSPPKQDNSKDLFVHDAYKGAPMKLSEGLYKRLYEQQNQHIMLTSSANLPQALDYRAYHSQPRYFRERDFQKSYSTSVPKYDDYKPNSSFQNTPFKQNSSETVANFFNDLKQSAQNNGSKPFSSFKTADISRTAAIRGPVQLSQRDEPAQVYMLESHKSNYAPPPMLKCYEIELSNSQPTSPSILPNIGPNFANYPKQPETKLLNQSVNLKLQPVQSSPQGNSREMPFDRLNYNTNISKSLASFQNNNLNKSAVSLNSTFEGGVSNVLYRPRLDLLLTPAGKRSFPDIKEDKRYGQYSDYKSPIGYPW